MKLNEELMKMAGKTIIIKLYYHGLKSRQTWNVHHNARRTSIGSTHHAIQDKGWHGHHIME